MIGMVLIPPKRICEEFYLTYELKGAQKGIDVLSRYYGIKRMKIVLDGRKVGKGNEALYDEYVAYFNKKGLNKGNVLHEFYHHLAYVYDLDLSNSIEERDANRYARIILKRLPHELFFYIF